MARSKVVQTLYSTSAKRELPLKILWTSRAFGVLAAVVLVTSLISDYQLAHLAGATVCFYAMLWICSGYELLKSKGKMKLAGSVVMRDILLTIAWALLMVPWLLEIF